MSLTTNDGIRRSIRNATTPLEPIEITTTTQTQNNNNTTITQNNDNDNYNTSNNPAADMLTPELLQLQADDDLSYQTSSHHSPSLDPTVTNNNTQTSTTINNNHQTQTITNIEQTLQQLTNRLNAIEINHETNQQRLEQQILQSNNNFQQQLLQSQSALAKIIENSITSLQQQPHPTPNPPIYNNHHTNDPPTTTKTVSKPQTNSQQTRSPDPPESTYMPTTQQNTIKNPYTTPCTTNTDKSVLHNQHQQERPTHLNYNPTPPSQYETFPSPHHQTQQIPNTSSNHHSPPNQPTIIVQAPTQAPRLVIDSYKKSIGYPHFKKMTLLNLSTDDHYSDIVRTNKAGELSINPHMSQKLSKLMYCATLKALGSNASEIINTTINTAPDAVALWSKLDSHFIQTASSHVLKMKIRREYEQMQRESNESFNTYVTKFENILETMRHNNIEAGSSADIAYRYLESLALPSVFNDILMNLDKHSPWAIGNDLRALTYKASNHHDKHKQIYNNHRPNPPPQNQQNQQQQGRQNNPRPPRQQRQNQNPPPSANPSNNQHNHSPHTPTQPPNNPSTSQYQRPPTSVPNPYHQQRQYQTLTPAPAPFCPPIQQPAPAPAPRPPSPYIRNEAEVQRIRSDLQTSANPTSYIHRLHQSQPNCCSLHSSAPHPIINCAILRNICNQTNLFDVLNNVRNDLQLPPMPQSGLLALPPRQYQQPYRPPAPAPQPQVAQPPPNHHLPPPQHQVTPTPNPYAPTVPVKITTHHYKQQSAALTMSHLARTQTCMSKMERVLPLMK
jgi:hypothetical protein